MIIVKTVTFEVKKEARQRFEEKFSRDVSSLNTWPGCLSNEVWIGEKEESILFTASSKWTNEEDFTAWMKRPERAAEHQKHKHVPAGESPVLSKTLQTYILFASNEAK